MTVEGQKIQLKQFRELSSQQEASDITLSALGYASVHCSWDKITVLNDVKEIKQKKKKGGWISSHGGFGFSSLHTVWFTSEKEKHQSI